MKIAFCGAQGVGKSTLVNILLDSPLYSNYTRASNPQRILKTFAKDFNINELTTTLSQTSIAAVYSTEIISRDNYISDRSLIDVFAYTVASKNISKDDKYNIINTFSPIINQYDIVFYIPIEFNTEEDGIRNTDITYRDLIDTHIKGMLNIYYINPLLCSILF